MNAQPPDFETKALPKAGWAVFAVLMALIAWAFFSVHKVKDTKLQGYPLVVADPSKLDFGERWEGETFTWTVPIRNPTDRQFEIARFWSSCGCLAVTPAELSLPPRGSSTLSLTIQPELKQAPGAQARRQAVEVKGLSSSGVSVFGAHVEGTIRSLGTFEPRAALLPGDCVRGRSTVTNTVTFTPSVAVSGLTVDPSSTISAMVSPNAKGFAIAFRVLVASSGPYEASVRIAAKDNLDRTVGWTSIEITGSVSEPTVASPGTHHFGTITDSCANSATFVSIREWGTNTWIVL
jgi:hypothetical protein